MRRWSILLIGLGIGLAIGASFGAPGAVWAGVAAGVLGMVLFVASTPDTEIELDEVLPDGTRRPTLQGLGTRVEQILRLAEEQANDHRAEAERDAARLLAKAEERARGIREAADADVWVVWRQDDNGNRFEVARVGSREDANALAATMEARGHKQLYWVAAPGPSQDQRGIGSASGTTESAGE